MYIVALEADADAVRKQMTRPTFEAVLSPVEHSSLQFLRDILRGSDLTIIRYTVPNIWRSCSYYSK